jgi:hypothetical protein
MSTLATFMDEYQNALAAAGSDELDVRPLVRAAAEHLRSKPPIPEIAPCLAALYFSVFEFESGIIKRAATWLGVAYFRFAFRGRPMWNDFYMALWQLSRCPLYVRRLHRHLTKANWMQLNTAAWMIGSVCEQDPGFKECWEKTEAKRGAINFGGPIAV